MPSPDQLVAFCKLADKRRIAGVLCREARDAELSASAAVQAEALFGGDDSLVVASLRMAESQPLSSQAAEASRAEGQALSRRSWAFLVSVLPLLLRRVDANTLLPGTIREEELDFFAHGQATLRKAMDVPVPTLAALRDSASRMGYSTLLHTMFRGVDSLRGPYWPDEQRTMVELFVLQGLDVIPRTAGIPADLIAGENHLVELVKTLSSQSSRRS